MTCAFDREPLDAEPGWTRNLALFEIRATIEALGGTLDEERTGKLAAADAGRRTTNARALALALRRPGGRAAARRIETNEHDDDARRHR